MRNIIEKTKSFEEKKYIFISYKQKASRNQPLSFKDSKKHIKYQLILLTIVINHLIISSTPNIKHPTTIIHTPKIQDNVLKNHYTISNKTSVNNDKYTYRNQVCNKHEIS